MMRFCHIEAEKLCPYDPQVQPVEYNRWVERYMCGLEQTAVAKTAAPSLAHPNAAAQWMKPVLRKGLG